MYVHCVCVSVCVSVRFIYLSKTMNDTIKLHALGIQTERVCVCLCVCVYLFVHSIYLHIYFVPNFLSVAVLMHTPSFSLSCINVLYYFVIAVPLMTVHILFVHICSIPFVNMSIVIDLKCDTCVCALYCFSFLLLNFYFMFFVAAIILVFFLFSLIYLSILL